MANQLKIEKLCKYFVGRNGERKNIFTDFSCEFLANRSYALVGPSGVGKSTFLACLAGLEQPDAGQIIGRPVPETGFFGLMFQKPLLIEELTCWENVIFFLNFLPASRSLSLAVVEDLFKKFDLWTCRDLLPVYASGGQQHRIALLRALVSKPTFLLADEPTSGLDRQTAQAVMDELFALQASLQFGIIVATHDPLVYERVDTVIKF